MNPPKKFPTPAPNAARQAVKPIQAKQAAALPTRPPGGARPPQPKTPAAPPPYRPQPTPKVLQTKTRPPTQPAPRTGRAPVAPPVYRPQPTPRVLQSKPKPTAPNAARKQPAVPPTPSTPHPGASGPGTVQAKLRPQPGVVQPPKAPAPFRPQVARGTVQPKAGGVKVHMMRPPAPSPRPSFAPRGFRGGGVIQRDVVRVFMKDIDTGDQDTNLAIQLQLQAIIESLDPIMDEAMQAVDNGTGLTNSTAAYIRDTGSRAAAAKRGTAIHAETYVLVAQALAQLNGHLHMLTETSTAVQPHFPHAIKKGRPDIRIALGGGLEAILDVTSPSEAKKKHCEGRHYEENKQVVFIGEMPYGGEED